MQTQNSQVNYSTRKFLIPKLSKSSKISKFARKFYKRYCSIVGPFHVLPDFYIIGGQKCGTTSMFEYLAQHPSVSPPIAKDIRFFDKYFQKGVNWYKVYFPLTYQKFVSEKVNKKKFITGEATERYLDHPHAPKRMKQVTPNAKIIVLLRNPVDRAYSHYKMIAKRSESLTFAEAINQEHKIEKSYQKMVDDSTYYDDLYFRHGYLHRGIYVDKLQRWMKEFSKEQFLIIQSEDFFTDPNKIYNNILEFLGLSKYELPDYKQFRKQDYSKSKLDSELRKKLVNHFQPHNERLYELLGKKFAWD